MNKAYKFGDRARLQSNKQTITQLQKRSRSIYVQINSGDASDLNVREDNLC